MTRSPEPSETDVEVRFEDVYRREYPNLIALATALSGRDGEDLVQEAMLRALGRWPTVRQLERPGGWCHRVLVNLCRSAWRRKLVEARFVANHRRDELSTPGPTEDVVAFWAAVRELPERPRLAFALRYAGDQSLAEVATILGVPEGTVSSDLTRARLFLKTRIER